MDKLTLVSGDPIVLVTKTKEHQKEKRKLQTNMLDEYRFKSSQQNISKLNPTVHKKDHTLWPSGIHPKFIRMIQYMQISVIYHIQFSRSVVSYSLRPHELQHARLPCPSPAPGVYSNFRPSSQWCHPAISSSVIPFSSCPQSLPASESFPGSQLFAWGGQSTGVSALASFLPKKSQCWYPSEWTGWISLQSKGPHFKLPSG